MRSKMKCCYAQFIHKCYLQYILHCTCGQQLQPPYWFTLEGSSRIVMMFKTHKIRLQEMLFSVHPFPATPVEPTDLVKSFDLLPDSYDCCSDHPFWPAQTEQPRICLQQTDMHVISTPLFSSCSRTCNRADLPAVEAGRTQRKLQLLPFLRGYSHRPLGTVWGTLRWKLYVLRHARRSCIWTVVLKLTSFFVGVCRMGRRRPQRM